MNKKLRIYFSRSKASHPDLISNIRFLLVKNNIEILEYKGGAYNENYIPALNPDAVLVLPPMVSHEQKEVYKVPENHITLGMGVDSESKKISPQNTFIVVPDDPSAPIDRNNIKVIPYSETERHRFPEDIREARIFYSHLEMKGKTKNLNDLLSSLSNDTGKDLPDFQQEGYDLNSLDDFDEFFQ